MLEDYETTMKYYFNDGKVLRYNNYCAITNYKILKWNLTNEDKIKEVNLFYHKYNEYCSIKNKKDTIDIQLRDKKRVTLSSLWIGDKLNELSRMCIKSWIKQGYNVNLYVDKLDIDDFEKELRPYIFLYDFRGVIENYNENNKQKF